MTSILIVDDEPSLRKSIKYLLEGEADCINIAATAKQAFEIDLESVTDLLIVDVMLQDSIDGVEVARRLKARREDLKIIFITGYASPDVEQKVRSVPDSQLIEKPFLPEEIFAAVRNALD